MLRKLKCFLGLHMWGFELYSDKKYAAYGNRCKYCLMWHKDTIKFELNREEGLILKVTKESVLKDFCKSNKCIHYVRQPGRSNYCEQNHLTGKNVIAGLASSSSMKYCIHLEKLKEIDKENQ